MTCKLTDPLPDHFGTDDWEDADSPLGPITEKDKWYRKPPSSSDHGGWDIEYTYYLDQYGNEYTSIEHVALCAVARALEVERG